MKMTSMLLVSALALANGNLWAGTGHQDSIDRLRMSSEVIQAILDAPDKGIPEDVLSSAKCIVVVPHLVKVALSSVASMDGVSRHAARPRAGALPHVSRSAGVIGDYRSAWKALTSSCWS